MGVVERGDEREPARSPGGGPAGASRDLEAIWMVTSTQSRVRRALLRRSLFLYGLLDTGVSRVTGFGAQLHI